MLKLWNILKDHIKEDFNWLQYAITVAFLAICISINYSINLEVGIIDSYLGKPIRILWYFLLSAVGYYGGLIITLYFKNKLTLLSSPKVWILTLIGISILAWSNGFPYYNKIMSIFFNPSPFYYYLSINLYLIRNLLTIALPLFIVGLFFKEEKFFGLTYKNVDLKPYWILLLLMLPLVVMGSFDVGFQSYYPTYKPNTIAELLHLPSFIPPLIYELFYGLDFLNVEFLFRGFFVIGLTHVLGKETIVPMVCAYCFLHFGKPIGETLSSIIGGYVLGVISFYKRNIWGGFMIHAGIAWMMEIAAFLQKTLQ